MNIDLGEPNPDGVYLKDCGVPLSVDDTVILSGFPFLLSNSPEESTYKGHKIRAWAVPDGFGRFHAVLEILALN